jgi:hypothetical protein
MPGSPIEPRVENKIQIRERLISRSSFAARFEPFGSFAAYQAFHESGVGRIQTGSTLSQSLLIEAAAMTAAETSTASRLVIPNIQAQHAKTRSAARETSDPTDGRQIERRTGIEDKSPFGVTATLTSERSIFEPGPSELIVGFDQSKAHFAAANEAFHGRHSPYSAGRRLPGGSPIVMTDMVKSSNAPVRMPRSSGCIALKYAVGSAREPNPTVRVEIYGRNLDIPNLDIAGRRLGGPRARGSGRDPGGRGLRVSPAL